MPSKKTTSKKKARAATKTPAKKKTALAKQKQAVDPFAAAKAHADAVKTHFKKTGGAAFALGFELLNIHEEIGVQRGGDREQSAETALCSQPWKIRVAEETGFSYRSCNNFMRAAEQLKLAVTGSRKKGDKNLRDFLNAPPREWNDANYEAFAEVLAGRFEASTFTGIMAELGFTPGGKELAPPKDDDNGDENQLTPEQLELFGASDFLAPILTAAECRANPSEFANSLNLIPLHSCEVAGKQVTGLHELVDEMQAALDTAAAILKSKTTKGTK